MPALKPQAIETAPDCLLMTHVTLVAQDFWVAQDFCDDMILTRGPDPASGIK
jgi:hypothetical protein